MDKFEEKARETIKLIKYRNGLDYLYGVSDITNSLKQTDKEAREEEREQILKNAPGACVCGRGEFCQRCDPNSDLNIFISKIRESMKGE